MECWRGELPAIADIFASSGRDDEITTMPMTANLDRQKVKLTAENSKAVDIRGAG